MNRKKLLITSLLILLLAGGGWLGRDWLKRFPLFSSLFGGFQQESVVTTSGLIGYFPMERNGTTIYDYSQSNHNGTVYGPVLSAPGKKGTALEFSSSTPSNRVNTGADWLGTGDLTVSAWIYPRSVGGGGNAALIDNGKFRIFLADAGGTAKYIQTYSDAAAAGLTAQSATNFWGNTNTWVHVTVTRSSAGLFNIYKNGTLSGSADQSAGTPTAGTANVNIGNWNSEARSWDGWIDELRVYNRILSAEEIKALSRDGTQTLGGGDKGLIAHYPLASENQVFQGTDLLSGWDFTSGWTASNATINSATQFTTTTIQGLIQKLSFLSVGSTYSMTIAGTVNSGYFLITNGSSSPLYSSWLSGSFNSTFDFTATVNATLTLLVTDNGAVANITSMTLKQEQTADVTPNSYHGTITAGSGGYTTDRHGQANKAYDFDNSATVITLPASSTLIPNANAVTFSLWAKGDADLTNTDYIVSTQRSSGSSFMSIGGTTSQIYTSWIYANNAAGVTTGVGTRTIDDQAWHHFVFVRNGANVTGYVDAVQDFTASDAGQSPNSDVGRNGNGPTGSNFFNGQISDVKIYNRVLTPTEITRLYDAYNPRLSINGLAKGLIAHYELTQKWSNGVTIQDLTPNNYTGTATSVTVGGRASYFDGANSTIPTTITANTDFTGGFTLSAWIKPNSGGEGSAGRIVDKSDSTSGGNGFIFWLASGTTPSIMVNSGTQRGAGAITYGVWIHVLTTVDSNANVIFYINGVASGSPGTTGALSGITTANPLTIGNRSTATDRTFDGQIADVRISDRVLSATEVTQLYNMGRPRAADRVASFNGTTQSFSLADSGSAGSAQDFDMGTKDFAVEFWMRTSLSSESEKAIIGKRSVGGGAGTKGWEISLYPGKPWLYLDDGTNIASDYMGSTLINDGKFHHTLLVFDRSGNCQRYTDGVADGALSISAVGDVSGTGNFYIADDNNGGHNMPADISSVRIYDFGVDGLISNVAEVAKYNSEVVGRIHPSIASFLVDGWDFDGEAWARTTWTHNLTNNGTATFVKP